MRMGVCVCVCVFFKCNKNYGTHNSSNEKRFSFLGLRTHSRLFLGDAEVAEKCNKHQIPNVTAFTKIYISLGAGVDLQLIADETELLIAKR